MKKRTIDAIRSFALLAGLFVFPMAAKAADFAPFTASSEMLTINGTAQTSAVAYYVGIGFNHDTLAISNGGSLTLTGAGYAGALSMGNGTLDVGNSVTVDGAGSSLTVVALTVGIKGGSDTLTVSNGGTLNGGGWGNTIGNNSNANAVTITGVGSTWNAQGNINLNTDSNSISVLAGGTVTNGSNATLLVGNVYSSNTLTVSGAGSLFTQQGRVTVGNTNGANSGNNNLLLIAAGGVMNVTDSANTGQGIIVAGNGTSTGNRIQIDGGTLNVVSAGSSAPAINVQKGALILNSGNVTAEVLLANTDATSVVTFNGGTLSTGNTTISNGAVFTVGNGTASAALVLNGGTHSFANGITLANNASLSGTGTITSGTLIVSSGARISPGNTGPGVLGTAAQTWLGGGSYVWKMNDATGIQGTNWDFLNGSGTLDISTLSPSSKFTIDLIGLAVGNVSGAVPNWHNTVDQTWKIGTFASITGTFNAADFNVDASGFTNNNPLAAGGVFSISNVGNDLYVSYTTPEPATWMLLVLAGAGAMAMRRRRA